MWVCTLLDPPVSHRVPLQLLGFVLFEASYSACSDALKSAGWAEIGWYSLFNLDGGVGWCQHHTVMREGS